MRSEVAVGGIDSNSPAVHTVKSAHPRSYVQALAEQIGALVSYCVAAHLLSERQCPFMDAGMYCVARVHRISPTVTS